MKLDVYKIREAKELNSCRFCDAEFEGCEERILKLQPMYFVYTTNGFKPILSLCPSCVKKIDNWEELLEDK